MPSLGASDLDVFPLALETNSFGWTASPATSRAILDAFVAGGGNFIDTAATYSYWVAGHSGGEAEAILGDWLAARGSERSPTQTCARCPSRRGGRGRRSRCWSDDASSAAAPAQRFSQTWVR
jgi:aryl-alcohol dehydrogenase-like predicted oxidoreductase